MAVSKAQQAAQNKWIAKAYDRINLTVEKGKRDIIKAHAAQKDGGSVNAFINRAIDETMERDSGADSPRIAENHPESAQGAVVVSLPSETLEAAQMAAGRTGESVTVFVARAVAEQGKRDDVSFKMGINPI